MTAADLFAQALDRHRAGDLDAAEALYRRILEAHAEHAGAWHLLGVVHTQRGRPELAVGLIGRALALQPNEGGFHLNLGVAQQALGRMPEAEACFRRAVELTPRIAEAHNNLANALYARGAVADARTHWGYALGLQPDYADAHQNLGRALADAGEWAPAVGHLQLAATLRPSYAQGHFQLGTALVQLRDFAAAAGSFRRAVQLQPNWPEALCGLGHVLHQLNDVVGAEAALRQALELAPTLANAHNALGNLLGGRGRLSEAAQHLRQAVGLDPANVEAHHNLGLAFKLHRRWQEAAEHLREALRLRPNFPEAAAQLSDVLAFQGDLDGAWKALQAALHFRPDEPSLIVALGETLARQGRLPDSVAAFRRVVALSPAFAVAHSCLLNVLNFDPTLTPSELLLEHRRWAELHAQVEPLPLPPNLDRRPERRLRIGYVSGDFVQHVLVHFVEPILKHHDPAQVEVFAYADVAAADATTTRLKGLVPQWRLTCGSSDDAVARQIQEDRIDLLVDLGGHTGTRLGVCARRPAPVQLTYLGYPNTTGLPQIDYRLTDAVADPPGEPPSHTEELLRLPGGFCCYQPPRDAPEVTTLPAATAGTITFGGLHKLCKLNDRVFDLWSAVLRAAPTSRLLLFRDVLRGLTADRVRGEFTRRGVEAERLRLEHRIDHPSFLAVYGAIDVALDALPWSGHATACEALWMGVPTLTLLGDRHAGRMVASVLTQVGLPEFIARTPEEFVARAVALTGQVEELAALRRDLRARLLASPLGDGRAFTRRLEEAYRSVWRRWATSSPSA